MCCYVGPCCRRLYFEEEVGKLKEKAAKEEKRKRRAKEDFISLLKETRRLKHDTPWSDAKTILEKDPEYKAVCFTIVNYSRYPGIAVATNLISPKMFQRLLDCAARLCE
jgi:hypothetical protein